MTCSAGRSHRKRRKTRRLNNSSLRKPERVADQVILPQFRMSDMKANSPLLSVLLRRGLSIWWSAGKVARGTKFFIAFTGQPKPAGQWIFRIQESEVRSQRSAIGVVIGSQLVRISDPWLLIDDSCWSRSDHMSKSRSRVADYLVYIVLRLFVCIVQAL